MNLNLGFDITDFRYNGFFLKTRSASLENFYFFDITDPLYVRIHCREMHGKFIFHAFLHIKFFKLWNFLKKVFFKISKYQYRLETAIPMRSCELFISKNTLKKLFEIFSQNLKAPPSLWSLSVFGRKTDKLCIPGRRSGRCGRKSKFPSTQISAKVIPFRKYIHVGVCEQLLRRKNSGSELCPKISKTDF